MTFMDEEDIKYMEELSKKRQSEEKSESEEPSYAKTLVKGVLGFVLTFIGIPIVLFGTCIFSLALDSQSIGLGNDFYFYVWLGFPAVLCIIIAWMTKNVWVIWGLLCFIVLAILIWLTSIYMINS